MKKIIYSMLAMTLMAFAFASCDDVPAPYTEPDWKPNVPGEDELPEGVYLRQDFTKSQGAWVIIDVNKPDALSYIWTQDTQYGMKATAYLGGTDYASESWIISPAFSLKDATDVILTFEQAGNFFNNIRSDVFVYISESYSDGGAVNLSQWQELTLDEWSTGSSWNFVTSKADLKQWEGKENLHIAFRYTSGTKAGTWEIKNVEVAKGTAGGTTTMGTADAPWTVAQALAYINGELGSATSADCYVKGKVASISEINWDTSADKYYGNATYAISDDGGTGTTLGVYRGYSLNNTKFTKSDEIKVGDEVIICGKLVNYSGNTPQFTAGSWIYSLNGSTTTGGGGGGDDTGGTFTKSVDDDKFTVTFTNSGTTASTNVSIIDMTAVGPAGTVQHQAEEPKFTLDNIAFDFSKADGNTTPKYWYTPNATTVFNEFRVYAKNKLTMTLTNEKVHSVTFQCSDTYNGTKYTGNDQMTATLSGKTFTVYNDWTGPSGGTQFRFKTITITYAQ